MTTSPPNGRKVVALAGGVGAARFLRGLLAALETDDPTAQVTVIGNTGDDITLFGLRVCPDLDTVMYTLGGGIDEGQGWGRVGDTFAVKAELLAYGAQPDWFGLGDRDLATHILRSRWLAEGVALSEVTRRLCERWQPGVRLLPMSDTPIKTHVVIDDGDGGERTVHFQEWWVRLHATVAARRFIAVGADGAEPAPGVLDAIAAADVVLFPPSNPVVSIGSILSVPGIRDALLATAAPVVGVSPIVGGAPVRGMADACLTAIGVATTARAVAEHYGAALLDGWLVDTVDGDIAVDAGGGGDGAGGVGSAGGGGDGGGGVGSASAELEGIVVRSMPLLMTDVDATAAIARAALALAQDLAPTNDRAPAKDRAPTKDHRP
jgi:LPPG:FO 2-phospho-L-lactate transferase